jgi:hypothetical protein
VIIFSREGEGAKDSRSVVCGSRPVASPLVKDVVDQCGLASAKETRHDRDRGLLTVGQEIILVVLLLVGVGVIGTSSHELNKGLGFRV